MEDILSRAWAHVKWEEDVASRAKAQQKQDPEAIRPDRTERDEKPSPRSARDSGNRNRGRYQNRPIEKAEGIAVSTWPDISHLSVSRPEPINVLRQMGQQVKWPQKMKAPDSFWNTGFRTRTKFAYERYNKVEASAMRDVGEIPSSNNLRMQNLVESQLEITKTKNCLISLSAKFALKKFLWCLSPRTPYILAPRPVHAFSLLPLSRDSLKMKIFHFSRSS
ncbi:hypothetical protein DY000_02052873 [Brassica cretica]|uniref:Uncharacterized protein n=1 Tax=Brassica cretica TaxID=69181 RepID=A0ABQ7A4M1_BRACR|nr:hypothetical protein DY000_02052873 [Brassica cretica]